MDDLELKQQLEKLEEQQRKILDQLNSQNNQPKRDFWEKLSAVSPIISGVAIALSALLCTFQYNQQQIKLQEAQTIERFIPHLMGNDTSKRMAILAMKTLVNTDLAAKYAAMFPSAGTISALKTIAKNGDSQDKKIVSKTYHEMEIDTKGDSISQTDDNIVIPNPAPTPDQPTDTGIAPQEFDTASDTTIQSEPNKAPEKVIHPVVLPKDHTVTPPPHHAPAAEDKESLEFTQPKKEIETRQPQAERSRSAAKDDGSASL